MTEFTNLMDGSELTITVNNDVSSLDRYDSLTDAFISFTPTPVDKIKVILYKGAEPFDSFTITARPKSRLCQRLVKVVNAICAKRNGK